MGTLFSGDEAPGNPYYWTPRDWAETIIGEDTDLERQRKDKRLRLSESERQVSARPTTQTQIVCGNCMGDETLPRKTFLTRAGACDHCGGRSYVLASRLFIRRLYVREPQTA